MNNILKGQISALGYSVQLFLLIKKSLLISTAVNNGAAELYQKSSQSAINS